MSSNTLIKIRYTADMCVEKWTKIAPFFFNQTAAEYSKIHVNFSIFCQDVLFGKLNMIAFSK